MTNNAITRKSLKVAVVGLGYFSQFHLNSWAKMENTELVAVCDRDGGRAKKVASDYSCAGFEDFGQLLEEYSPDILDLVVPPVAQANVIELAARKGRLLICQKPFCRIYEEAVAITKLAADRQCNLIIHENFRFQPWHRTIKKMIEAGEIGEVYQALFTLRPGDGRGKDAYLARQPAFQKMEKFLVHETGVHFIDLHQWLFGEIESVYADLYQLNPHIAGEDAGKIIFRHASGARSEFDGNRLLDHAATDTRRTMGEMIIEGTKGSLRLDGFGIVSFRAFGSEKWLKVPIDQEIDLDSFGGGCVHALNCHAVANFGSSKFENTAQEYLRIIEIEDAIYRSNNEKRQIDIF